MNDVTHIFFFVEGICTTETHQSYTSFFIYWVVHVLWVTTASNKFMKCCANVDAVCKSYTPTKVDLYACVVDLYS